MPECVRLYLWFLVCVLCAFAAHEARGCNGTRRSLRPPLWEGYQAKLGQFLPRARGIMAIWNFCSSCPRLSRASTSLLSWGAKDVDGRANASDAVLRTATPGHDDGGGGAARSRPHPKLASTVPNPASSMTT